MACRVGKGPRRHRCSWHHHDLMEGYYLAREAQERRAEAATHGYDTELAAYFDRYNGVERRLTFKTWLIQSADRSRAYWSAAA